MKIRRTTIAILTLILIINIIMSYSFYNASLYEQIHNNAELRLNEMASFGYHLFDNKLQEQIHSVETAAQSFGIVDFLNQDQVVTLLDSNAKKSKLLRAALSTPEGNFITSDNLTGNVKGADFFETAMGGEFFITDPTPAVVDATKKVLLLTSPIVRDGQVIGTLTFSYLCDELEAIFSLSLLDNAHTVITNANGDVLMGTLDEGKVYDNVFTYIKDLQGKDKEWYFSDRKGKFDIEAKEEKESILAKYNQLTKKDWYAITIVKKEHTMTALDTMNTLRENWNNYIIVSVLIYGMLIALIIRNHAYSVDKLTGLKTFDAFKKKANELLENNKQRYIIIKLDIRNFKLINRIYGFDIGNEVIKNMASSLKEILRDKHCLCARLSIDNFILMLPYESNEKIDALREMFVAHFRVLMGTNFVDNIDFPTGQYTTEKEGAIENIEDIYEKVNFAHQYAKQNNIDLIVDYEETLEKNAIYQKDLEDRMQSALFEEQFKLYVQPKYCLLEDKVCSGEALIRWQEKDGNILSPGQFIPLFEKNGFIVQLDKYMFEKVAQLLRNIIDEGREPHPISVNFSRLHLHNENLVSELCEIANRYHLPHHLFEVELTESIVFENIEIIISLIDQLHENGFSISIDDFGAGYSSLSLLKDVKVDVVKLDCSFFSTMKREERSDIVINNILRMTKELNIKTVAEGIETEDYVLFLKECQCDMIQGYYYSKPISQEEYKDKYFK